MTMNENMNELRAGNHICAVPQCGSWAKKDIRKEFSFHFFPPENERLVRIETESGSEVMDRRKAWIMKLNMGKPITKYMRICSLHFKPEDYCLNIRAMQLGLPRAEKPRLKKTAVPSLRLPEPKNRQSGKSKIRVLENMNKLKGWNPICAVPQCGSWAKKDLTKELSFHRFPPENVQTVRIETESGIEVIERRKAWIMKLNIDKPITENMRICSLHFKPEDYCLNTKAMQSGCKSGVRRILKKNAVPSLRLPKMKNRQSGTSKISNTKRVLRNSKVSSLPEKCENSDTEKGIEVAKFSVQLSEKDNKYVIMI